MADRGNVNPEVSALVNDFLQYKLSQSGFEWSCPSVEAGRAFAKVGAALRDLADEFASQYKQHFVEMCEKLELNEVTLKPTIDGVANELFSEGIKWARIVALLVFGSELAMHCKDRNWPHLINIIAHSLSTYISEKLLPWVNDHGGWEGLVVFNENADEEGQRPNARWPSVKNLLCLGVLGALSIGAYLKS